jgi:hypothetical protein
VREPPFRQNKECSEIQEGLNVIENWNGANSFILYGKGGEIATNHLAAIEQDAVLPDCHAQRYFASGLTRKFLRGHIDLLKGPSSYEQHYFRTK